MKSLKDELKDSYNISLTVIYSNELHDREIRFVSNFMYTFNIYEYMITRIYKYIFDIIINKFIFHNIYIYIYI